MPAGDDVGVRRRALDELANAVELLGVVERSERDILVVGHAGLVGRSLLDERGDELVVNRRGGEHARRGGAVLPGVEIPGHRDGLGGGGDVGVIEDDHRRLAAELEVDALEVAGRSPGDLDARRGRCR